MEKHKNKDELKKEYQEFIKTNEGNEWINKWKNYMCSDMVADFGDYLYDFYPEMLQ